MKSLSLALCCLFGLVSSASAVKGTITRAIANCSRLDRRTCRLQESCVWLNARKKCTFDYNAKCDKIETRLACRSVNKCTWTKRDKCIDEKDLQCANLASRKQCFRHRKQGCLWLRNDGKPRCLGKNDISCSQVTGLDCRQVDKCTWQREKKQCISNNKLDKCQDCSNVVCTPPQCSGDAELVTLDGECCPKCVVKEKCQNITCRKQKCFEGETLVQETGKCCPECKRSCPCPMQDCSKVRCPPVFPCAPGEERVMDRGGCCTTCVKRVSCRNEDCNFSLECKLGEVVETKPGDCCPSCMKKEECYEPDPEVTLVCDGSQCDKEKCKEPQCDPDKEVVGTEEGECCPRCFPKKDCQKGPRCSRPRCQEGERKVIKPGECCPTCEKACTCQKPDCSQFKCSAIKCARDEDSVPFAGGCCNTCVKKRQCRIACGPAPFCDEGQVVVRVAGDCCLECRDLTCLQELPKP